MAFSNMTPREELNLHGSLTLSTCERLVALHEALDLDALQKLISDAYCALPSPDTWSDAMNLFDEFYDPYEGHDRDDLEKVRDKLVEAELRSLSQADEAAGVLGKLENMLGDLEDLT